MTTKRKQSRYVIAISLLLTAFLCAFLLGGCADVHYANTRNRSPEAKYNTFYAPDYYPYYPWDGYYGGAYYYGDSELERRSVTAESDKSLITARTE